MAQPDIQLIDKTIAALKDNRMDAYYVPTNAQAMLMAEKFCEGAKVVASGGSTTLAQTGIEDYIKSGKFRYIERSSGNSKGDPEVAAREVATCDVYFMSSNAITQSGELYNVDGTGNRVAALAFGPKSVVVVAGYNKIVYDAEAARERVRKIAAPMNAKRLNRQTPCTKVGYCCDCRSPQRICCVSMLTAYQRVPGRIKVIIVGEELGY